MESNKKITLSSDAKNVGTVQIADEVVAMVAALAATEVDGVSALAGNITNEAMSKVGVKKLTKGVRVSSVDNEVNIDLAVVLEYGYNIPETCHKVQLKVKSAIENMTGLVVTDVNIRIASVHMPGSK